MKEKKFLIYLDILGFKGLAEQIAVKKGIYERKVREDFVKIIEGRIEEIKKQGRITGEKYGESDDWLLVVDCIDNVFISILRILEHNTEYREYEKIPLEIAIGIGEYDKWAKFEGRNLIFENDTIAFLNTNILKYYREWYKHKNKQSPKSTFIILTESAYQVLETWDKEICEQISCKSNGKEITFFNSDTNRFEQKALRTFELVRLKEYLNQAWDLKNYLKVVETKYVQDSVEHKKRFHSIVPLSWDYIIASADSKRDLYDEIWPEVQNDKQGFRFFLILGEPLSGKSTLMRRLGFDLVYQSKIVLQVVDLQNLGNIWNHIRSFYEFLTSSIYILIDDVFDNDDAFKDLRRLLNEGIIQDFNITVIGTAILNPNVQRRLNDLHRTRLPIFSKELKLTEGDKQRILESVGLDQYSIDSRTTERLMARNRFYTFLAQVQFIKGNQLISEMIPSETTEEWRLKNLKEQQPRLYEAYKYICFVNQHKLVIPLSIIQRVENYEFSDILDIKGHEDWIFKSEAYTPENSPLEAAHWFLAKIYWENYVQSKSPKNILTELVNTARPNNSFEELFVLHLFRICIDKSPDTYKPILEALSEKVNILQGAIGVDHLLIWQRIYLKIGMKDDAERCFTEAKIRTAVNTADLRVQISLFMKTDPNKALELLEEGLSKYPDDKTIKVEYLKFLLNKADRFSKHLQRVIDQPSKWLIDPGENWNVLDAYIDIVIAHAHELVPNVAIIIRRWLTEHHDHRSAATIWISYLKLIQHDKDLMKDELRNCWKWLLQHRTERGYIPLMHFYAGLISKNGTDNQKQEVLTELLTWLGVHPKAGHIWVACLNLLDSAWAEKDDVCTVIDTIVAQIKEIEHPNAIVKLLDLIEKWATPTEKKEIINKLHNWLEIHWDDNYVRSKYIRFVGKFGTEKQVDCAIEQNKRWLKDHLYDENVRVSHLSLVAKRRRKQVDIEIIECGKWLVAHPEARTIQEKIDSMNRKREKKK